MTALALAQGGIPVQFAPVSKPGRLRRAFGKISGFATRLRTTFKKVAPVFGSAALGAGFVYGVRVGALAGVGMSSASGLTAVGAGALVAGGCATGAQYLVDCYKAKRAGRPLPEFSWKNYGLKGLFNTLGGAFGAGAMMEFAPESVIDKITHFFRALFNFFSVGEAQAAYNAVAMAAPVLGSVEEIGSVEFEELSPASFFETLDTAGWNKDALAALEAAQKGQIWGMQNIAHFAARPDMLGENIRPDYDLAAQAAAQTREAALLAGDEKKLGWAEKFLTDIEKVRGPGRAEDMTFGADAAQTQVDEQPQMRAEFPSPSSRPQLERLDETLLGEQARALVGAGLAGDTQALGDAGLGLITGRYGFEDAKNPALGLALLQEAGRVNPMHALSAAYYEFHGLPGAGLEPADRIAALEKMRAIDLPEARKFVEEWERILDVPAEAPADPDAVPVPVTHECSAKWEFERDVDGPAFYCKDASAVVKPGDTINISWDTGRFEEVHIGELMSPKPLPRVFEEELEPVLMRGCSEEWGDLIPPCYESVQMVRD